MSGNRPVPLPLFLFLLAGCLFLAGCHTHPQRFTRMSPEETGIHFANNLTQTPGLNIFNYLYFYDGGGVAAGDLNGDRLPDLFFTSNQEQNKLYLNKGSFRFQDITGKAIGDHVDDWTTGVTMVDINSDGRLDIYVSNVGGYLNIEGRNRLYVNRGNDDSGVPRFEEQSARYGLDLKGFSTQAAFFDYDRDGDLDMYMMNHSVHSNNTFDYAAIRERSHPLAGDKLLRNDDGTYVDVTEESGIYHSALGYGLGIGITDFNKDGYPDIYIGNDFHEDDYLYINNGNGTFTESLGEMVPHTSRSSMGNELVDINNDGRTDIYSLDMLPSEYEMLKASAAEDPIRIYMRKLKYGYKHQFSRNTLQLNRGHGKFSDIGLFSGVYATNWSWATLGADFNHNGYVDLFVTNGIKGRTNELDYIEFISRDSIQQRLEGEIPESALDYAEQIPREKVSNVMYSNKGKLKFEDVAESWGLAEKSFSNGAAYADLDLDGDLDLVVNNVDQKAFVYRNNTREKFENSHYLKFKLDGPEKNPFGIGTTVRIVLDDDHILFREMYPVRGYQSSVGYSIHVGLDSLEAVPRVVVTWPDGKRERLVNMAANQTLTLQYSDAKASRTPEQPADSSQNKLFTEITNRLDIAYKHDENNFLEYNREALIPKMLSREGPALAVADVNGDGLEDFYAGGAKRQPGELYLQNGNRAFVEKETAEFENDSTYEDTDAVFGDFDLDGDQDLFVVSGGNEFYGSSEYMLPRLYINDGSGNFVRDKQAVPGIYLTGSVAAKSDVDNDGDSDLFVGARTVPWKYGVPPTSYLLINEEGTFRVEETGIGEKYSRLGMVTDARWADMNGDEKPDLVVASEWSEIKILYQGTKEVYVIPGTAGLWNTVEIADLNKDGANDIIAGNLGLNSKYKASLNQPMKMYVHDFDKNGSVEQLVTYRDDRENERLFATKDELAEQMSYIHDRFATYRAFAEASLTEVVEQDLLDEATTYTVHELQSAVFYNRGESGFDKTDLPAASQFSPLYGFLVHDITGDGFLDVVGVGNFYDANIQRGRYDASYGSVLVNDGDGALRQVPNRVANWFLEGQIRTVKLIEIGGQKVMITAENDGALRFFKSNG